MMPNSLPFRSAKIGAAALLAASMLVLPGRPALGAEIDKLDCSIKQVPADIAFYVSFLRNRAQLETVLSSKAWARFMALPGVKAGWEQAWKKLPEDKETASFIKWVMAPENKEWVDLFLDMLSHEVFIYGGDGIARLGDLYGRFYTAALMEGFQQGVRGDKKPVSDEQVSRLLFDQLSKNLDAIQMPDLVVGFRVSDPKRTLAQLKRLEKLIRARMDRNPEAKKWQDQLKWTKLAGSDFLTLSGNLASAAQFDEQAIRKYERKPGDYDALVQRVRGLKSAICLGVRGNYVILAMGESTAVVEKLGGGKRLIILPELKPLAKYAGERLTSIGYSSKAYNARTEASYFALQNYIAAGRQALAASNLKPEVRARIEKDLVALGKDLKAREPQPGAQLAFNFQTARGIEGYAYDYRTNLPGDGSKPLTILNHVGGDPLLVVAGRSKYSPAVWPRFVHWIKVAYGYMEEFGTAQPEQKKKREELFQAIQPLLEQLDKVTGKMFLPALADGQWAFVLDSKLASKQWLASLPELPQAVPMPEPALVYGVSDAAMLQKAMSEYRILVNAGLAAVGKTDPGQVPDFQIPAPKARQIKGGSLYFYPLPDAWGLDKRLLPNAALSREFAALTLSQQHSERLLTSMPLKTSGTLLTDSKRPLVAATHVNAAKIIDLFAQWSELAAKFAPAEGQKTEEALKQVRTVYELLKVFREYSSITYQQGAAQVTHSEAVFVDVKYTPSGEN